MIGILQLAKERLAQSANPEGVYVDFTMGKGRDTLFLASLAPRGRIYAFDVQPAALEATRALLDAHGVENVTLIQASHERFREYVEGPIDGGLFNLGFLPAGTAALPPEEALPSPPSRGRSRRLKSALLSAWLYIPATRRGGLREKNSSAASPGFRRRNSTSFYTDC